MSKHKLDIIYNRNAKPLTFLDQFFLTVLLSSFLFFFKDTNEVYCFNSAMFEVDGAFDILEENLCASIVVVGIISIFFFRIKYLLTTMHDDEPVDQPIPEPIAQPIAEPKIEPIYSEIPLTVKEFGLFLTIMLVMLVLFILYMLWVKFKS